MAAWANQEKHAKKSFSKEINWPLLEPAFSTRSWEVSAIFALPSFLSAPQQ